MSVRDTVVAYIERISNERDFDEAINLFESGLLTSLDILSLVDFIERTFAVQVSAEVIDMESFGTIDGLVATITKMQAEQNKGSQC